MEGSNNRADLWGVGTDAIACCCWSARHVLRLILRVLGGGRVLTILGEEGGTKGHFIGRTLKEIRTMWGGGERIQINSDRKRSIKMTTAANLEPHELLLPATLYLSPCGCAIFFIVIRHACISFQTSAPKLATGCEEAFEP